ncbi:MAG: serine hydrolase domain-containing protein [Alphaproteobacteria bacterium]|nr:serine hydrolase domain-containing protein [Alphaproteobacteria bacterium]
MTRPMPTGSLNDAPVREGALQPLFDLIQQHIAQGRYPGAQIALGYRGELVLDMSFGQARTGQGGAADGRAESTKPDTLWLLYSNTKVIIATTLWLLHERGLLRFTDRVTDYLPEFAAHGKQDITLLQVITHQAGYPGLEVTSELWHDHARVRQAVCDFVPEWPAGSKVSYHGLTAHWTLAMVIEAVTGQDYRQVVREQVLQPLGLADEIFLGLPEAQLPRMSFLYEPDSAQGGRLVLRPESTSRVWQEAGVPGGGAYGTARGMAALYQMMLQGGRLGDVQLLSPRTLAYALRNYTGDRVDEFIGMPMHRGLGPHLRGHSIGIRGLGSLAHPGTFGHGGVGTSYCWADPQSGLSFAYITNARVPDPWHSLRLDQVSNLVHAAIQI